MTEKNTKKDERTTKQKKEDLERGIVIVALSVIAYRILKKPIVVNHYYIVNRGIPFRTL